MEVLQWLITDPNGTYIDGTLGGGGHSLALLSTLGPQGTVIGLDRDPEALAEATARLASFSQAGRFAAVRTNFGGAAAALARCPLLQHQLQPPDKLQVDGMLLDLGVSSHQLDDAARGFSHRAEGPLDMRMAGATSTSTLGSAADLCNEADERELGNIIYQLGEERRSRKIAAAIVRARPLSTTAQLAAAVRSAVPPPDAPKALARVFQALRMRVNSELEALEAGLAQARGLVRPSGRIVVLSYHSLEDRRVKRVLATGSSRSSEAARDVFGNVVAPWRALTRKPIVAGEAEVAVNPRARSVKMRVAERTDHA